MKSHIEEQVKFLHAICSHVTGSLGTCCYRLIGQVSYTEVDGQVTDIKSIGQRDLRIPNEPTTPETIFDIASVSKQFTAATILKLWDNEAQLSEKKHFPNGIDTPINNFTNSLESRFPQCKDFFAAVKKKPEYIEEKITLRDLLNHTHGLGRIDDTKMQTILDSLNKQPIELYQIINTINDVEKGEYKKFSYSAIGIELTAMIIECITNKPYDLALREIVLDQYGLVNTYTQSDVLNKNLFESNYNIARGCTIEGYEQSWNNGSLGSLKNPELQFSSNPADFDYKGDGRAAIKLRSNATDLAKFAKLFMGGEMFESDVVKSQIQNLNWDKNKYDLCITDMKNGFIGHPGGTQFTEVHLKYHPETKIIKIEESVLENVTNNFAIKVFQESFSKEECQTLAKFMEDIYRSIRKNDVNDRNHTLKVEEAEINAFQNAISNKKQEEIKLFENFMNIHQEIVRIPIESLMDSDAKNKIVPQLVHNIRENDIFSRANTQDSNSDGYFVKLVKSNKTEATNTNSR